MNMNIEEIRKDFPILNSGIIYMDSAATSLTPEPVLDAVLDYYRNYNANVGRGVYKLTQIASQKYEDAHRNVAKFIGTTANELIFTKNTTEGINTVASGIGLKKEDKVVVSLWEHHSNLLPWIRAKKALGIDLEVVKPNAISESEAKTQCALETSDFVDAIDKKTKIVAITHVSNALGSILPVKEISKLCAENEALLLVDAAQSAPHMKIDVRDMGCDFLAFSGHKMPGPTGIGGLVIKEELMDEIEPLTVGGGAVEDASFADYRLKQTYETFESGTPNIAGAMGLSAAAEYLGGCGMDKGKFGRRDRLVKDKYHDTYREGKKRAEPSVCSKCGSVYTGGRWTWTEEPEGAAKVLCPACQRIADRPKPRVLIGGLGMGFTLAAALRHIGDQAQVVVAELVPAVVAWNKGPLGEHAGHPLQDPRVIVREGDVARILKTGQQAYDAILLDVDNGPEGLTHKNNDWLYSEDGLAAAYKTLRPQGVLAVWSAGPANDFLQRLRKAGFDVDEVRVRAHGKKGARHIIWFARREF